MTTPRTIRTKITGISKIQKITQAMQSVAAGKMYRAKARMLTSMPYAQKIHEVVERMAATTEIPEHPYLTPHAILKRAGLILVTTDRGLCGGLNLNPINMGLGLAAKLEQQNVEASWCLIGKQALNFFKQLTVGEVLAKISDLGDIPQLEDLLGAIKVMLDAYRSGTIDELYLLHNEFVSSLKQQPKCEVLLPLIPKVAQQGYVRGYIYEPREQFKALLTTVFERYLEMQIYQAVVENIACEQIARMMAMQNATDNSRELIGELRILYNKTRQAAITSEIAEIVNGADAV